MNSLTTRVWDVVVVGAGPAGSVAARALALRGHTVLLVDRNACPRYKVCGCCLNARALATLDGIGLSALVGNCGSIPLHALTLFSRGRSASIRTPEGAALSRESFDSALISAAAAAGVLFSPSTRASLGAPGSDHRRVTLHQGAIETEIHARLILAADGLAGSFLGDHAHSDVCPNSRLGAGTTLNSAPESLKFGAVHMACGRDGYVGVVRIENACAAAAAALDSEFVKNSGGLGPAAQQIIGEAGLPDLDVRHLAWRGTPPLTRRSTRLWRERVLLLGDATGYIEPFTGEGMSWALSSAARIVPLAECAIQNWSDQIGRDWAAFHHRVVARRQLPCAVLSRMLRHPALVSAAVRTLHFMPRLAAPLTRRIAQPQGSPRACPS